MAQSEPVPPGVDITRPSAARVYDYFLGGAHNFAVDRELAWQIAAMTPGIAETMRANRAFLQRAVRTLVGWGIRQFLDIGSGIPTVGNVHEIAQQEAPDARVVYVDIDPIAVAHSRQILAGNEHATAIQADVREADRILGHPDLRRLLDLEQPVALLLAGVLHFVPEQPAEVVRRLADPLVPGSYLLISHATYEDQPPEVIEAQKLSRRTGTEIVLRSHAEIAAMFGEYELVEPGLVHIPLWRPESPADVGPHPELVGAFAGVGRKP